MATLVSAFDCEAMRNSASMVILRPASLSIQPTRALVDGLAVAQHQRDDAAERPVVHVGVEQGIDARQPLGREARAQRVGMRGQARRT